MPSDEDELRRAAEALDESGSQLKLGMAVAGFGVGAIDYLTDSIVLDVRAAVLFALPANTSLPRKHVHAPMFKMQWTEDGGPPVASPARKGFGQKVIGAMAAQSVNDDRTITSVPRIKVSTGRSCRFLALARGFWAGTTRKQAWLLTAMLAVCLCLNLAAAVAVNLWYKSFFDALEQKNASAIAFGLGVILALVVFSAAASVAQLQTRTRLQLRWRQWLAGALITRWLTHRHFYQLTIFQTDADNPEARIAEDGRTAIDRLVDFSLSVINALLVAVSFISILWIVGGSLDVAGIKIPSYMVFACIAYSALCTSGMFLLGRYLVRRVEERTAGEAQLRYELTRVKDNAEIIALMAGDNDEHARLEATLSDLMRQHLSALMWQSGGNYVLAPVVPLQFGAPKYLAGEMSLGSLMQAAAAFAQEQVALNWLTDNAVRLADSFAASHRVTQLSDALRAAASRVCARADQPARHSDHG